MYITHPHLQSSMCYVDGLILKYIYVYTVGWKGKFNLWETILEHMFVEQLFFEKDLKQ